jgi:predicted negative regulator of RcsB-dependent stress response
LDVYKTDEEQAETIKHWLRENGMSLITGLLLGLAVLFGFKSWTEYGARQSEQASNLYVQFTSARAQGLDAAVQHYDALIKDFSGSEYAVLASLDMGRLQIEKNDLAAARAHLQWALEHAQTEGVKLTARLRLARVMLAAGEIDAAEQMIAGMAEPSFVALYEELRGDIARARGDMDAAHAAYERALAAMPEDLPGRALIEAKRDDAVREPVAGQAS